MSNLTYEHLHHNLKLLKLTTIESILDNYLEVSIKEGKSFMEIIDYLVEQEIQSKEARSKAVRMRIAGFLSTNELQISISNISHPLIKLLLKRWHH